MFLFLIFFFINNIFVSFGLDGAGPPVSVEIGIDRNFYDRNVKLYENSKHNLNNNTFVSTSVLDNYFTNDKEITLGNVFL